MDKSNNKSTITYSSVLLQQSKKDTSLEFRFPFLPYLINRTLHSIISLSGVIRQFTIDEVNNEVFKHRNMHDLSDCVSPKSSINDRLIRENLPEIICGFFLMHILHYAHSLNFTHPDISIPTRKIDMKSAYLRYSLCGVIVSMSINHLDNRSILNLRQNFGGTFGPWMFSGIVSEPTTNLSNDVLTCTE